MYRCDWEIFKSFPCAWSLRFHVGGLTLVLVPWENPSWLVVADTTSSYSRYTSLRMKPSTKPGEKSPLPAGLPWWLPTRHSHSYKVNFMAYGYWTGGLMVMIGHKTIKPYHNSKYSSRAYAYGLDSYKTLGRSKMVAAWRTLTAKTNHYGLLWPINQHW